MDFIVSCSFSLLPPYTGVFILLLFIFIFFYFCLAQTSTSHILPLCFCRQHDHHQPVIIYRQPDQQHNNQQLTIGNQFDDDLSIHLRLQQCGAAATALQMRMYGYVIATELMLKWDIKWLQQEKQKLENEFSEQTT